MNRLLNINYFITLLILAILTTSCSKSNVPPPTPLEEKPPQQTYINVKWQTNTGNGNGGMGNYNLAPTYTEDSIFVPNENGLVYALDAKTGKVIWQKDTNTNLSAQPNYIANAIILGSIKGDLIALDTETGLTLWHTHIPSSLLSQPTIYDSIVYTYTHDGSISAIDAKDGEKKWNVLNNIPEITLPTNSSPIVLNNTVMIGSAFGTVLGFTAQDGDRTINIPIAIAHGSSPADKMVDITANPMLYGDYLIFASYQGAIVALDKDNGKMLWAKKSSIINNMTINDGIIFTTQSDSSLKAFDIQNGDTTWTQDILKWRKITGPIYYKGLIVVADYQGYLHFFNSLNGEYLGRFKLTPESKIFDYGISGQLIPTEEGIIIQAEDGTIYLVDAYSDKVIYDSILSDYKIDRGTEIKRIYPVKTEEPAVKDNGVATNINENNHQTKGLKVKVIIGDFSQDKQE
ncbi:outer membrane protein assembly factor BamB [Allofrancisella guangzhouensis]|uniref:Outer membrane protein assembly factor BamB n=1 Tax=Allofrancisella guangzhouensis TaxID=594679 RepID=A0A0A8E2K0_9GAMM|nr:outer membrane protein assembly factor BamB [Allofrancisella guangzhouensis]AJC48213.1 outer membrane protein assembly factor BamB [Allofrancisella guangzhouensis]MBK2027167.1 outer membrane protein assembly factor BamB [Allofrancisella guangzhouensis]MBK2044591.1 outer membrane protein assembly factor BamB [Allofrancisella guangzhouensis]MBK2045991.1 outer membrane protein assembly factor BamB [Allofrancisella guangzhouensis]